MDEPFKKNIWCKRHIYLNNHIIKETTNINPYLIEGKEVWISNMNNPLCDVPEMVKGNSPVDGGYLLLNVDDYREFCDREPESLKYIRRFYGAREFLHNIMRWCIWIDKFNPREFHLLPMLKSRISETRTFRLNSKKKATQKYANFPWRFMEIRQKEGPYILIPRHSSENRRYIPFGYITDNSICGDANSILSNASVYTFGVLNSNVHMTWMRTIAGRLKSDYRYSNTLVYNNFPWPTPTEVQKANIEKTAQDILAARALYADSSLAELYDEITMPPELRKAHQANDRAVMEAYGFDWHHMTEPECVAELMKMYQVLVKKI